MIKMKKQLYTIDNQLQMGVRLSITLFSSLRSCEHLKIHNFTSKGKGQNYKTIYEGEKDAGKKGKIHDSLGVPWTDGRFYIYEGLPGFDELKFQLLQFPKCEMFDCIDTFAMGTIVLRDFASPAVIAVNRLL